jgi:hypothetical protein
MLIVTVISFMADLVREGFAHATTKKRTSGKVFQASGSEAGRRKSTGGLATRVA